MIWWGNFVDAARVAVAVDAERTISVEVLLRCLRELFHRHFVASLHQVVPNLSWHLVEEMFFPDVFECDVFCQFHNGGRQILWETVVSSHAVDGSLYPLLFGAAESLSKERDELSPRWLCGRSAEVRVYCRMQINRNDIFQKREFVFRFGDSRPDVGRIGSADPRLDVGRIPCRKFWTLLTIAASVVACCEGGLEKACRRV